MAITQQIRTTCVIILKERYLFNSNASAALNFTYKVFNKFAACDKRFMEMFRWKLLSYAAGKKNFNTQSMP